MSFYRFFLEDQVLSDNSDGAVDIRLSEDDIRHMKVARISPGEIVAVIDSSSDYFLCEVEDLTPHGFIARISTSSHEEHLPFKIDLFQGIPKSGKMKDIVRHGIEVGIDSFVPVACKRSIAKIDDTKSASKIERLQKVAKSAAMQSGRAEIPEVHFPIDFDMACDLASSYDTVIVFWEEADSTSTLRDALADVKASIAKGGECKIAVFVGPEGGFDEDEIAKISSIGDRAHLSTLGQTILRTETAGVVGCALVSYELGGMGACSLRADQA